MDAGSNPARSSMEITTIGQAIEITGSILLVVLLGIVVVGNYIERNL